MKLIIKKLLYCNTNEQMEKLSTIPWEILDNKQIKHKFELENSFDNIT